MKHVACRAYFLPSCGIRATYLKLTFATEVFGHSGALQIGLLLLLYFKSIKVMTVVCRGD